MAQPGASIYLLVTSVTYHVANSHKYLGCPIRELGKLTDNAFSVVSHVAETFVLAVGNSSNKHDSIAFFS